MKFIPIFEPYLFSISLNNKIDELSLFIDFLTDTILLENYFNENKQVLDFYNLTKEEAILQTSDLAEELYYKLEKNKENLDRLFQPLRILDGGITLQKMKLKSNWIRIYGIKLESKYFVITGGAIKQSQIMQDHYETVVQLNRLKMVKAYLEEQGILDIDGFFELINE
jgi:hypothetical protein